MVYYYTSAVVIILSSFLPHSFPFGLPGFSWGWRTAPEENITKVITSEETVQRYPLQYPFKQCSAGMEGLMTSLFLYPCVGENGRCQLTRGENVTLDLEFITNFPTDDLVGSLSAIFSYWLSPLQLGEPENLCKSGQISCPVQPFYPYRYRITIFIRPSIPALSPDIKVMIKTSTGRSIACAIVPVTVVGNEKDGMAHSEADSAFRYYL